VGLGMENISAEKQKELQQIKNLKTSMQAPVSHKDKKKTEEQTEDMGKGDALKAKKKHFVDKKLEMIVGRRNRKKEKKVK
jgi:hypothetical protein